jgi:hypothetical protein
MSHRLLRSYAKFLVVLGWLHVLLFALLGFAPWLVFVGQPIPAIAQWKEWALYVAPAAGLLVGALFGLAYLILSGVVQVFLDQRDLLEEILLSHRRLLQLVESRQAGGRPSTKDPFDLSDIQERDEPLL